MRYPARDRFKRGLLAGCAIAATAGVTAGQAQAAPLVYDQNVTPDVINGDGIDNGDWTIHTSNGIELGLRAKLRHNSSGSAENTFNSNGDGTYSFSAGSAPGQTAATAVWSYEWSINTDVNSTDGSDVSRTLGELTYLLSLDRDPGAGTNFVSFDPIHGLEPGKGLTSAYWDHALGFNDTGNGAGQQAADSDAYADALEIYNVAQNSWKPHWQIPGFDPTLDGLYDFNLAAYNGTELQGQTRMQVIVGDGAPAPAPAPAALLLFGAGLLGLGLTKRRHAKQG